MNVYIVWVEILATDGWRPEYYLFVAAKSHSHAKYQYACFGEWGGEYFQKQPEGVRMHCHLVEHNAPYAPGELMDYELTAGVDLIMNGVILPNWCNALGDPEFDDYRRWDGFRKPKPNEMERS